MHYRRVFASTALIAVLVSPLAADWPVTEKLDLDAIYRIKEEGLQRSKVMEIESYLTDVYGPRLTGSPNIKEAADWAQKTMKEWGLANVQLETFPFGRGWQNQRFVAHALTPRAYPLIAYPKAWTPGTNGPVTGEAVMAVITSEKDFDTLPWQAARQVRARVGAARRAAAVRGAGQPLHGRRARPISQSNRRRAGAAAAATRRTRRFVRKRTQFWIDEGVAAVLDISRGDGGTLFVQSGGLARRRAIRRRRRRWCWRSSTTAASPARSTRTCRSRCRWTSTTSSTTTISTPSTSSPSCRARDKADEVVMLGAHFDSWHTRHGRDRQRRRLGGDDGSDAHPEDERRQAAAHGAHRAVGRRGAGAARVEGVRQGALRRSGDDAAEAGAREVRRLLQRRQRHRRDSRRLSAGQRSGRADLPGVDGAVQEPRHDDACRSATPAAPITVVRRGRPAGLPVHPGSKWSTTRARTTRTWTSTSACRPNDMMRNAVDRRVVRLSTRRTATRSCRASRCRSRRRRPGEARRSSSGARLKPSRYRECSADCGRRGGAGCAWRCGFVAAPQRSVNNHDICRIRSARCQ